MVKCNSTFAVFVLDDDKYVTNKKPITYINKIEACAIPIAAVEKFLFLPSV